VPKMIRLKDPLYYLSPSSGASVETARGVLIGIASVLIGQGMDFATEVVPLIKSDLPENYRPEAIPETWREAFRDQETAIEAE